MKNLLSLVKTHFPYLINDSQAYEWFIGSEVEEINLTLDEIAKHTPDS